MAKTITIDDARVLSATLYEGVDGAVHVEIRYQLLSGGDVVRETSRDFTPTMGVVQRVGVASMLDDLLATVKRVEL